MLENENKEGDLPGFGESAHADPVSEKENCENSPGAGENRSSTPADKSALTAPDGGASAAAPLSEERPAVPEFPPEADESSAPRPPAEAGGRRSRRLLKRLFLFCFILALLAAGAVAGLFYYYGRDLPEFDNLKDYSPPQVSKVYDRSGVQIAEFFTERRTYVGLDQIPPVMLHAIVSAEDGKFYKHHGLDYIGILRAMLIDLKEMRLAQGASTITQQLIKNMVLSSDQRGKKFSRKIREAILARRIEQNLTKDEILVLYLNHIYFGHGRYGIFEASLFYFGKEPKDLTLAEAAMLAGLPQSPGERLSPLKNPTRARQRRAYVLDQMARNGFVSREEADAAAASPLNPVGKTVKPVGEHYVEAIRRMLLTRYDRKKIYEGGLRITVAMDAVQQKSAESALAKGLEDLERRNGLGRPRGVLDEAFVLSLREEFQKQTTAEAKRRRELEAAMRASLREDGEESSAVDGASEADEAEDEISDPVLGWDFGSLQPAEMAAISKREDVKESPENSEKDSEKNREKESVGATAADIPSASKTASRLKRVALVPGAMVFAPVLSVGTESVDFDLGTAVGRVDISTLSWAGLTKGKKKLNPGDIHHVRVLSDHPARRGKKKKPLSDVEKAKVPLEVVPVPSVQAALAAVDPKSHQVTAIVGGYDFSSSQFNRATQARRQPGSSFKPIVYGAALESGRYTLASIVNDAPDIFRDPWTGKAWRPQNYEKNVYEGPMTLREALSKSKNTVSVRLIEAVGPDAVIDFARRAGITSPLPENLTLGLGTGEVTPLELANAYATLAAGGMASEPSMLLEVKDSSGAILEKDVLSSEETISPEIAFLVTSLMRSVVEQGTGKRALALKRPVAGKTGTTSKNKDAWFSGFTPELAASVWVGRDDHKPIGRGGTGGAAALPIWVDFMKEALKDVPPTDFAVPDGVEAVRIDPASGKRIAEQLPEDADDDAESVSDSGEGNVPSEKQPAASSGKTEETAASPRRDGAKGESAADQPPAVEGRIEYFVIGTAPEEEAVPKGEADPRLMLMEEDSSTSK